ncbi:MAG: KH domain-containing protein [Edaphobacter sp.]|uniref:KH domain-containing protein n=1 Tax=Edaphobacter sp. TaxID=1934404 RepID=UPI00238E84DC|nr:KH domain-containing protein [Edaphobacter sp.]MDE1175224.1 KH domain-containing protein [Edaphobacter sp.]
MTQPSSVAGGGDDSTGEMTALVVEIAKALVDSPESVIVEAINEGESTVIRLRVAPTDIGKVIGKQGRTARSLRTILAAASMKLRRRFALDIVEDHSSQQG